MARVLRSARRSGRGLGAAALLGAPALPAAAQEARVPDVLALQEACDPDRARAFGELEARLRSSRSLASASPALRGAPRGYLGLRLSEVSAETWTPDGRLKRYCAYPLVVSVEPASPAERAGLDAGDTLVAYGAHDLVRGGPVALDRLLVPGASLRVRLRRNGRTLTRTVVVGRAPSPQIVAFDDGALAPLAGDQLRIRVAPMAPRPASAAARAAAAAEGPAVALAGDVPREPLRDFVFMGLPQAPAAPGVPRPPRTGRITVHTLPPGAAMVRAGDGQWLDVLRALPALPATAWASGAPAALAGAQVVALDDDLREVLARSAAANPDEGPVRGVFVLKVLPGTPAAEAGLRAGDVVTTAGGRAVTTPAALQRVLATRALSGTAKGAPKAAAEGEERDERRVVPLRVWRAGVARDVSLRW